MRGRELSVIKRRVFYSFHYDADNWRAATVRNMGAVEGNRPATDNGWETVKRGGDAAIRRWIDGQLRYRSCTLVLVGSATAGRPWIGYEIGKSWKERMGLAGIHIHGLRDRNGRSSWKGRNPFQDFTIRDRAGYQRDLASVVKCYEPPGSSSKQRYAWIEANLANIVEEAVRTRAGYP